MPEHIRALIIILILSAIGFIFAKKITENIITKQEFERWRNLWFIVTLTAFLSHNFWIYVFVCSSFILLISKNERNKVALFFILFIVIPPFREPIPGFGLVNFLVHLDHLRLVSMLILAPAAMAISYQNSFKFTKCKTDIYVLLYMVLIVVLYLRDTTFTDSMRQTFYIFIDIFLPYYVASRAIKDRRQMDVAISAFIAAVIVMAVIASFESVKHWLLYSSLPNAMGVFFDYGKYLGRGDSLRAIGTLAHPIALGYFMVVGLGLYFYQSKFILKPISKYLGYIVITLGLMAPVSRGPWTGAVAMILVFIIQGPKAIKRIGIFMLICVLAFMSLFVIPNGQKYLNLIPFYGKTEVINIEYREKLFENSMIVISKNPFFGSTNYLDTPEMREMIQGEGIVDLVNFYISILLESGYVGLFLFLGAFISVILGIRRKMRLFKKKGATMLALGISLISVIVAILLILVGASTIGAMGYIYWGILGLGVAYWKMAENEASKESNSNKP
jgi:O-antigen ligase